jgi:hypothetical protein
MSKLKLVLSPLALLAVAASCGSEQREVMVPSSQVAARTSAKDATDSIARTRCQQETTCNAIGPGKKFGSQELCLQVMRADAAEELGGNECMDGVADRYLNACLADVASGKCSSDRDSFDKLKSYDACRTGSICLG